MSARPAPFSTFAEARASRITVVFSDLDDTITSDGQLGEEAFSALRQLNRAGFQVIHPRDRPTRRL